MRWYKIQAGNQTWDATGDPYALNVEFDIIVSMDTSAVSGSSVKIWGIPLSTLLNANQFNNQFIYVYGGMQQGLPLANAQAPEAGLLVYGKIFPCLGNWINTEMTLDFYIANAGGAPLVPKAANVTLNWLANTPLSGALQQALQTAFPAYQVLMRISQSLTLPNDEPGFFQTFHQLNRYAYWISKKIMNSSTYQGVSMVFSGQQIIVDDGTQQSNVHNINPWDLVGQPVWINLFTISVKVVMRGDIKVYDYIVLPPTLATLTPQANAAAVSPQSGLPNNLIQGKFYVTHIRHVGNFRQPDWASWVTIIECTSNQIGSGMTSTPNTNTGGVSATGGIGHM